MSKKQFPHKQPFNVWAKPSGKKHWSKVRGHNNLKRGAE